jgi:hypothetical protein
MCNTVIIIIVIIIILNNGLGRIAVIEKTQREVFYLTTLPIFKISRTSMVDGLVEWC